MKKVLLLGGSQLQVLSVKTAKRMGYYTIVCDYNPNNPGRQFADEYHCVSTTDKEAVLRLARELKVDGIVCYASDPAAPIAAYVSEHMGLSTSPLESVEVLAYKDKFREFLAKNNFNVPKAKGYAYEELENMLSEVHNFKFPVIVKPVDSSGSRGVKRIDFPDQLRSAVDEAMIFSRCKRFIVEEYVDGYQIEGDGFTVDGKLVFWCFANVYFDESSPNPNALAGQSWPCNASPRLQEKIHEEIQRALTLLGMKTQAYNFEVRIDKDENVYLIEIGPRNGGNNIPQITKYATGVDMVEYTIKAAIGEGCGDIHMVEPTGFWANYVVHSQRAGALKEVWLDEDFRKNNIVEFEMMFQPGDKIEAFMGSNGMLGTMILKFSTEKEMLEKMNHMEKWVKVKLQED